MSVQGRCYIRGVTMVALVITTGRREMGWAPSGIASVKLGDSGAVLVERDV